MMRKLPFSGFARVAYNRRAWMGRVQEPFVQQRGDCQTRQQPWPFRTCASADSRHTQPGSGEPALECMHGGGFTAGIGQIASPADS